MLINVKSEEFVKKPSWHVRGNILTCVCVN